MRNCASGDLEIPGSMLRIASESQCKSCFTRGRRKSVFRFKFQTATKYTTVIARLDRAIQYSRDACVSSRRRGVLDAPLEAGHDESRT
jgi:hypothetical protein